MGWLGIVFKESINGFSVLLAAGLTTGFLGSLTTFSGWNQKMLELATDGQWVVLMSGYAMGMWLAYFNIEFGVWIARVFRWLLSQYGICNSASRNVITYAHRMADLLVFVLALGALWAVSGALSKTQWETNKSGAQLWLACLIGPAGVWLRWYLARLNGRGSGREWLACLIGPAGVWLRWYLARLNGRGSGREGLMKWIPFGTLIANVVAACFMAALATVKQVGNDHMM
ncbi:hypothetical protein ACLOJK_012847 [Asimina triloba]